MMHPVAPLFNTHPERWRRTEGPHVGRFEHPIGADRDAGPFE